MDFDLAPRQTLCILGESGSGKSVTLRALMRLNPPRRTVMSGSVQVGGHDLMTASERRLADIRGSVVSMIFQEPMTALDPVFTIGRQIRETIRRHERIGRAEAQRRALELLELVQIPSARRRLDAYPHELSGGLRQRAMIAIALSCRPRLLLADEPTTALDATVQIQILLLLRRLQAELGMGMIFVTHDLGVAGEVADRIAVMYAGRFVEEGPVAAVMRDPLHPYAQGLLGATVHAGARGTRLTTIPGAPPNLEDPPEGCAFAARCPPYRAGLPAGGSRRPASRARPRRTLRPGRGSGLMLPYMLRRVAYAIPIALAVSLVCFMLVHIAPGDPVNAIVPADAPQDVVDQIRHDYGLDRPLPIQFGLWLAHVVTGDLGRSLATGRSVWSDLSVALVNTLRLAAAASLIGFTLGVVLGGLAGAARGTWVDRAATGFAVAGVSVPHYWLGMVMVVVFSVLLGWLPAMGAGPGGSSDWAWDWPHLSFLLLPAVTLSVIPMGIITRTVRGIVAEVLGQDFVNTLRGKGLLRGGIFRHVARNAAPGVLAVMGLQLGYLMGGSILVETVFSWPGTGLLLNSAIFQRDIPVLQGTILVLALFFVAVNLVVDVVQTMLDPRIKRA